MCTTPHLAAADKPVDGVVGARNAESVFMKKNNSLKPLIVLSIGPKDDNGESCQLDVDPWISLPALTVRPQRQDLAEEIICHYVSENLFVRAGMK
jgi:hypothetical protein